MSLDRKCNECQITLAPNFLPFNLWLYWWNKKAMTPNIFHSLQHIFECALSGFSCRCTKSSPAKAPSLRFVNIWWENNKRTPITHASTLLKHYQSRRSRELQIELQQSLTRLRSVSLSAVIFFKKTWRDGSPIVANESQLRRDWRALGTWSLWSRAKRLDFRAISLLSRRWRKIDLNSFSGDVKIKSLTSD